MSVEFKLPDLGEGIDAADVVNVLVGEGDVIAAEQNVLELETDKAVVELPCPHAGRVTKVHVKPGDKVAVGGALLTIQAAEQVETHAAEKRKTVQEPPEEDAAPEAEEAAPEPQPAQREQPPRQDARETPRKPAADEGAGEARPAPPAAERKRRPPPAGPAVRRQARKLGVDLYQVSGSGPGGRITAEDVEKYVQQLASSAIGGRAAAIGLPPLPDFSQWGEIERVPLSGVRRKTAEAMSVSWQNVPHVHQFDEADITELEAARRRYNEHTGEGQASITVTVLALKASVAALKAFPHFNASLDPGPGMLIVKKYYHLGVAVDTEHGLLVPVLRDVDRKSVRELARELDDLARRARERKLGVEELRGGTFTISNLGGIGGTNFTPIVYHPQVAILGIARGRKTPVLGNDGLENRLVLPLSLAYDHRVIDGADGARFLRKIASLLADPMALLLEG